MKKVKIFRRKTRLANWICSYMPKHDVYLQDYMLALEHVESRIMRKIKRILKRIKFNVYMFYLIETCGNVKRKTYLNCLNCRQFYKCQSKFLNQIKWII